MTLDYQSSCQTWGNQLGILLRLHNIFRTKLDWCMPPVLQATRAVKEIAKIYINGDKDAALSKHALPILGDRAAYVREGKVIKRQRTEDVRLPFLL